SIDNQTLHSFPTRRSSDLIERATSCIKRFKTVAEARGVETIVAVATASIREARNSARFIKDIEQQTGIKVEVLSGIEEARLIGLDRKSTRLNSSHLGISYA